MKLRSRADKVYVALDGEVTRAEQDKMNRLLLKAGFQVWEINLPDGFDPDDMKDTFNEYFEGFKNNIFFAIRRQWVGQSSNNEHGRALGLTRKAGNAKWVYDDVKGLPRISKTTNTRWREDVREENRKTVYMIFVEKC